MCASSFQSCREVFVVGKGLRFCDTFGVRRGKCAELTPAVGRGRTLCQIQERRVGGIQFFLWMAVELREHAKEVSQPPSVLCYSCTAGVAGLRICHNPTARKWCVKHPAVTEDRAGCVFPKEETRSLAETEKRARASFFPLKTTQKNNNRKKHPWLKTFQYPSSNESYKGSSTDNRRIPYRISKLGKIDLSECGQSPRLWGKPCQGPAVQTFGAAAPSLTWVPETLMLRKSNFRSQHSSGNMVTITRS